MSGGSKVINSKVVNSKTIQLNPMFLSSSSSRASTPKKEKKPKINTSIKPNAMKKQLLAKIKDFQNKCDDDFDVDTSVSVSDSIRDSNDDYTISSTNSSTDSSTDSFDNEFNKSLNFLSNLSKERSNKKKPKRNETLKKSVTNTHIQVATELPDEMKYEKPASVAPFTSSAASTSAAPFTSSAASTNASFSAHTNNSFQVKTAPVYSNLKGGNKPTYRQYHNKTQKNYGNGPVSKPLIQISDIEERIEQSTLMQEQRVEQSTPMQEQRQEQSNPLQSQRQEQSTPLQQSTAIKLQPEQPPVRYNKRITRNIKYSLGKHKNGKVSILIKNAKTRRKIQTEQALLKQTSISDIKHYLRGKNLLKVGSEVPNDVLRQMYENAILAGDVTNKSKDTLIHNFLNDK
jgi:hypothetical protein